MLQVKVVKASGAATLEEKINTALANIESYEFVDLKVSGANNGKDETFVAVILYK
ncbi:sporulation protein Cse60 [Lysinibacillus mangiferihumi]|uniref:Sporulation protein Cse60 n=1 Tax=Lysinibacillus mangiferihumi TaxID=1130819 RepID=A0A4U2XZR1_9BACI|nr:sporulation protein Cse60 [Lysinibacillus mangiferihumi]TKI53528.1 sporulation protein Cse60 [Lysinibacillus mangiferihumi]